MQASRPVALLTRELRAAARGGGYGSLLSRRAIALADADPTSEGIDLTTELRRNLSFYEAHEFRVVDSARINDDLETWTLGRDRGE